MGNGQNRRAALTGPAPEHWCSGVQARESQQPEPVTRSALLHMSCPCSRSPKRADSESRDQKSCWDVPRHPRSRLSFRPLALGLWGEAGLDAPSGQKSLSAGQVVSVSVSGPAVHSCCPAWAGRAWGSPAQARRIWDAEEPG